MPKITSCKWDEENGVCRVHYRTTPCHICLITEDPDVEVIITEMDRVQADWDEDFRIVDTLPVDHADWLKDRII